MDVGANKAASSSHGDADGKVWRSWMATKAGMAGGGGRRDAKRRKEPRLKRLASSSVQANITKEPEGIFALWCRVRAPGGKIRALQIASVSVPVTVSGSTAAEENASIQQPQQKGWMVLVQARGRRMSRDGREKSNEKKVMEGGLARVEVEA